MSQSPKYPLPTADLLGDPEVLREISYEAPAGLYAFPSFKLKCEIRPPAEPSIEAYYRAYPQFRPRPLTQRQQRRLARRGG